ncbi:unnamed protein product [Prunus armeniaca]|uniref:F-box domain-containing protein n=1 Tax=Prunus armeniaca TaxID=36596 RepID=A0A6J5TEI6_PRUAR|nr:unnamed protein product [Prunus armeniaca]
MSILPPELILDILLRLPHKDLIRSLCVSKAWYAFIHDQRFIKAHLQRSIETNSALLSILIWSDNPEDAPSGFFSLTFRDNETIGAAVRTEHPFKYADNYTDILGNSVHGLVCIRNCVDWEIALWNPSIQKLKKIPFPSFEKPQFTAYYGFGYDSVHDDYKVAGIGDCHTESRQVHIYSLKSNSWKRIQNMPCNHFDFHSDYIVFFNGALNWLMHPVLDETPHIIQTLNLASEEYCQFSTPVDLDNVTLSLEVLGGCLCLCVDRFGAAHDVWVMKEYGMTESWTLLFSIEPEAVPSMHVHSFKPLVLSKNGEMVLLKYKFYDSVFFWYDLKKKSFKQVEFRGHPHVSTVAVSGVGSLCLLDPVIVGRDRQVPSTSKKRKLLSREGSLDLVVKSTKDDQS